MQTLKNSSRETHLLGEFLAGILLIADPVPGRVFTDIVAEKQRQVSKTQGGVAERRDRSGARSAVDHGLQKFRELGSARQVLLWMASQNVHFPYPSNGRTLTSFEWRPIRYRNIISILKNPFYAGVYAYGKSEKRTTIVDGRARKSYGHRKPMGTWEVFIKDHHEGYISWAEYERNQALLAGNAYGYQPALLSDDGRRHHG